jgi:curved DNA-binding protein CbpA
MVKADPTRNYYADLKITASASENEIRKAFRALALQYHPDRNPGREAEFVVKFQEIQAAHEILGDQTQRIKYDTERRKYRNLNVPTNTPNTPRSRPPPPPRNAYTTSTPSGVLLPRPTTEAVPAATAPASASAVCLICDGRRQIHQQELPTAADGAAARHPGKGRKGGCRSAGERLLGMAEDEAAAR